MKKYFFVVSNGHAASKWLAKVLALDERVVCSHGCSQLDISINHDSEYSDEQMKQQMLQEHRKNIPIDDLLEELVSFKPSAEYYGNVHMFNLRQLVKNVEITKPQKKFKVVELIRHPISFIQSGTHNMHNQCRFNPERIKYLNDVYQRNVLLYDKYAKQYQLDLTDIETLSFMANVMTLYSFRINFDLKGYERYQMEKLTKERSYYGSFYKNLFGLVQEPSPAYLDLVFAQKKTNQHKKSKAPVTTETVFNNWTEWKQKLFLELFTELGLQEDYEECGYEFSFL